MSKKFIRYGVALTLLAFVLAGCFSGPGSSPQATEVTGTIVEVARGLDGDEAEVPLAGVTVKLGSQSTETGSNGVYTFKTTSSGSHTLIASLEGYGEQSKRVTIDGNVVVDPIVMVANGGELDVEGTDFAALDGATEDTKIVVRGNTNDFKASQSASGAASAPMVIRPLANSTPEDTTAITVAQLQALINGVIHDIQFEDDGSFEQELPIEPGSNTIQLRAFSEEGDAYTTPIVRVTSTLERLDLRVVMKWDTNDSDVDLHMLKRRPNEPNPASSTSGSPSWSDRHVGYYSKTPRDFGEETVQNPFLDIDDTRGYGPETIVLQEATPGYYHIWVHFYSIRQAGPTNVTVDVILNEPGRAAPLHETFVKELTENKEYWYVGTVAYPAGEIIQVDPTETTSSSAMTMEAMSAPSKK